MPRGNTIPLQVQDRIIYEACDYLQNRQGTVTEIDCPCHALVKFDDGKIVFVAQIDCRRILPMRLG